MAAKFHGRIIILMLALFISNGAFKLAKSEPIEDDFAAPAQSPSYSQSVSLKESSPSTYQKFLDACVRGMTEQCAVEIVDGIFEKKKVTKVCCVKLVRMGNDCHNELVKRLMKIPEFKKDKKETKSRSDHIWSKCCEVVRKSIAAGPVVSGGGAPPEREKSRKRWKFLEKCAKKMSHKCADQIVGNIFSDKKVCNKCCVKLLDMGEKCHKALVKQFMEAPQKKCDKKKIKLKSDMLWKKCEKIALSPPAPVAP